MFLFEIIGRLLYGEDYAELKKHTNKERDAVKNNLSYKIICDIDGIRELIPFFL